MTIRSFFFIAILLILFNSGCASTRQHKPAQTDSSVPSVTQAEAVSEAATPEEGTKGQRQVMQELTLPEFKAPKVPKALPPKEPIDTTRLVRTQTPTLINTEAMPLADFIVYALGDILKVTFFIDEHVKNMKNPVTLRMGEELSPDKVLDIVIGFLEKYELIVEARSGALYITKTKPQAQRPVDVRVGRDVPESPADIIQIIVLKHVRANEISGFLSDIYKTNVNIKVYFKENALVLSGQASAIREVVNLINLFDVPYMQGKRIFMLNFTYWQTDDFIRQITTILEGLGFTVAKMPKDAGIYFITIKALNSVIVVAPDEESMRYVLEWHKRLDVPEAAGTEEKAFIYRPRHSKASDLVESLKRLYVSIPTASLPAQQGQAPAQPATQAPRPQAMVAPTTAAFSTQGLKVAADDRGNMVLISASPAQYKTILNYIESLDIPPRQVLLAATIAELTLKDDLQYGLEWYIKGRMKIGTHPGDYILSTLGHLGIDKKSGLGYSFIADSSKIEAVLNLFASENKINILSSPRLLVLDNQEASIQVGTDVPVISGETKTNTPDTGNTVTTQSVQYRSTGLILKIRPNINTQGMLTLDISLESSEAQQNKISSVNSPVILTRNLKTNVAASTDKTIILGGIMSENISNTDTKVPLLGDIPILGSLFKNTSSSKTKTELIITIRPLIISTAEEAATVTNEIIDKLQWFK